MKANRLVQIVLLLMLFKGAILALEVFNKGDLLWLENGTKLENRLEKSEGNAPESYWLFKAETPLDLEADREGGFIATPNKKAPYAGLTTRMLPTGQDYPWLVLHLKSVESLEGSVYRSLVMSYCGHQILQMPRCQETGIFTFNLGLLPAEKGAKSYFRFDLIGIKAHLLSLSQGKAPENTFEIRSENREPNNQINLGDKIFFSINLKEEAEDVTVDLFDDSAMTQIRLNGLSTIQLKTVGGDKKRWAATIALQEVVGINNKAEPCGVVIPVGKILAKAIILGTDFEGPLLTSNLFSINPQKKETAKP